MDVREHGNWLDVELHTTHRALSWAVVGSGYTTARRVSWRQVSDSDLTRGCDPRRWTLNALRERGEHSDIVLLTSRRISTWERVEASDDGVIADCVATVGLSNALRVGVGAIREPKLASRRARARTAAFGTINLLCRVDRPLADEALIEALSIATEARTLAVLERRLPVSGGAATGTGTDCIVIASPLTESDAEPYAGKHTAVGRAIGRSVRDAVGRGADRWIEERKRLRS